MLGAMPHPDSAPVAQRWIVLLAHGSRQPSWADPFAAVLEQVRAARTDCRVELAFVESMAPLLVDALREAARAGCRDLHLVPLLLGAGGHLRRDIPQAIETVAAEHPELRVHVAPAAGEHEGVIAALAAFAARSAPRPDPDRLR